MAWKPQRSPLRALASVLLCLAGNAGWTAASGHAHAHAHGHATDGPVTGTLEIKVSGDEVRAVITYTNVSSRVVGIEKLEEGQAPPRAEFEIRYTQRPSQEEGQGSPGAGPEVRPTWRQVPYTGPLAKRASYSKADFLPLEPGRSHRREIRLDERYGFPEGEHTCTATHICLTWNYAERTTRHRTLRPVTFTYSR
jgi:hypothetical protein